MYNFRSAENISVTSPGITDQNPRQIYKAGGKVNQLRMKFPREDLRGHTHTHTLCDRGDEKSKVFCVCFFILINK